MGAGASIKYVVQDFEPLKINEADIDKISALFQKIDKERKDSISLLGLLNFLQIPKTEYLHNLFTLMDENGAEFISFKIFVYMIWNYCTLTDVEIATFIYHLYNENESTPMEPVDAILMLHDVNGKAGSGDDDEEALLTYEMVDEISSGPITLHSFKQFFRRYPELFAPAIAFRERLRTETLGQEQWNHHTSNRGNICEPTFDAITAFLKQHLVDPEAQSKVVVTRAQIKSRRALSPTVPLSTAQKLLNKITAPSPLASAFGSRSNSVRVIHVDSAGSRRKDDLASDAVSSGRIAGSLPTPRSYSNTTTPTAAGVLTGLATIGGTQSSAGASTQPPRGSISIASRAEGAINDKLADISRSIFSSGTTTDKAPVSKPPPATTKATSTYYKDDHSAVALKADVKITRVQTDSPPPPTVESHNSGSVRVANVITNGNGPTVISFRGGEGGSAMERSTSFVTGDRTGEQNRDNRERTIPRKHSTSLVPGLASMRIALTGT